jgi:hypothetical protein
MPHAVNVCRYTVYSEFSREIIISIDPQTIPKKSHTPTPFSDETPILYNLCLPPRLINVSNRQHRGSFKAINSVIISSDWQCYAML